MKTGKTHKEIPWSQIRVELSKDEAAAQGDAFFVLRNKTRLRIIHLLRRYSGLLCAYCLQPKKPSLGVQLPTLAQG